MEITVSQEQLQDTKTNLTLQDIAAMVQVIQVATERGAWKPDELSTVGVLYDRMMAFLGAAGLDPNSGQDGAMTKE